MDKKLTRCAEIIREYMHMHHVLEKSDVLLVCGSSDLGVAHYAAELFHRGIADYIICSGGFGKITQHTNTRTEAEVYAMILQQKGVPETALLLEKEAVNTGENIRFSMEILKKHTYPMRRIMLVTKPYHERRVYAAAKAFFPEVIFLVTSSPVSFLAYTVAGLSQDDIVHLLVGDIQRIIEYPKKGFQIPQEVRTEVIDAYEMLKQAGYTRYLIQ